MWNFLNPSPRFCDAMEEYLKIRISHCCERAQKYSRYRINTYVYPLIGNKKVNKVRPNEILLCIQAFEASAPSQARSLLRLIHGMYRLAKAKGWCRNNPAEGLDILLKHYKCSGFNYILPKSMPDFLADVQTKVTLDKAVVTAFWLLVYTAVRRSEAVEADISEFDLDNAVWIIPAERMKMKREHIVPLAPQVVKMLTNWLKERPDNSNKLFGEIGSYRPLYVITQAGWKGRMTIHGLRKVFSTHAHESGLWSSDAIELQLAHKNYGVRGIYNKAQHWEERRRLMNWYVGQIDTWRNITQTNQNKLTE